MKQSQKEESKEDQEHVEMINSSSSAKKNQHKENKILYHTNGNLCDTASYILKYFDIKTIVNLSACNKSSRVLNPKNAKDLINKIGGTGYDYFIKNFAETHQQGTDTKTTAMLAYLVPNLFNNNKQENKDNIAKYLSTDHLVQPQGLDFTEITLDFDKNSDKTMGQKIYHDHIFRLMSVFKKIPHDITIIFSKDNIDQITSLKNITLIGLLEESVQSDEQSKYYLIDSVYRYYSSEDPKFVLNLILKNMSNSSSQNINNHAIEMIVDCIISSKISASEACDKIQYLVSELRNSINPLVIQKMYQRNQGSEESKLDILKALAQEVREADLHYNGLAKQIYMNIVHNILENHPSYLLKLEPYHIAEFINFQYIDYHVFENIYSKDNAKNGKIIIDAINYSLDYADEARFALKKILKSNPKYSMELNQNVIDHLRINEHKMVEFINKNREAYKNSIKNYPDLQKALDSGMITDVEYYDLYEGIFNYETTISGQSVGEVQLILSKNL
jgi:hypothetical protein